MNLKEPGIGIVANENTKTSTTKGSTTGNIRYSNNLSEDRKMKIVMKKMADDLKRERELVGGEDPEWEVWGCNYPPEGWHLSLPMPASKKRKVGDDKLPSSSSSSTTASPKNGAKEESLKIMPLTKAALRVSSSQE
jgi:hypothetical protein